MHNCWGALLKADPSSNGKQPPLPCRSQGVEMTHWRPKLCLSCRNWLSLLPEFETLPSHKSNWLSALSCLSWHLTRGLHHSWPEAKSPWTLQVPSCQRGNATELNLLFRNQGLLSFLSTLYYSNRSFSFIWYYVQSKRDKIGNGLQPEEPGGKALSWAQVPPRAELSKKSSEAMPLHSINICVWCGYDSRKTLKQGSNALMRLRSRQMH